MSDHSVCLDVQVRVYVLRGRNLAPMDATTNSSDPYLKLKCGKLRISDRKNAIAQDINPDFHRMFQLEVNLPGQSGWWR